MCIADKNNLFFLFGRARYLADFLNLWEALPDENGDLIEEYAQPDGYHLKPEGYTAWVDYLCSHTAG